MDSRVRAAIAGGRGLVTVRDLRGLGFDTRQIARWVREGLLVAVRRGVYTTRELWESWDEYRQRPLARVRATELTLQIPHVISHDSAALLHGVPLLRPHEAAVHVTRRHLRGSRTQSGVHHHGARYREEQVLDVEGLAALDIARTVADIAREHGYRAGLVAADGALQLGVPLAQLAAAARDMAGWPDSLVIGAVLADADPGAESVGETLSRELVWECGLGAAVESQFPVATKRGVRWCDLRVGRHLVEFHGAVKYLSADAGGVADRSAQRVAWDERRRGRDVCDEGFGMTPLIYEDFWGTARDAAKRRLAADYAETERRYGVELSPRQAEVAARLRGQRRPTG